VAVRADGLAKRNARQQGATWGEDKASDNRVSDITALNIVPNIMPGVVPGAGVGFMDTTAMPKQGGGCVCKDCVCQSCVCSVNQPHRIGRTAQIFAHKKEKL
jgi:hypothetical protein